MLSVLIVPAKIGVVPRELQLQLKLELSLAISSLSPPTQRNKHTKKHADVILELSLIRKIQLNAENVKVKKSVGKMAGFELSSTVISWLYLCQISLKI